MAKILLVEDDNNLREIYGARLTAEGYTIVSAPDGEEALAIAVKEKPDLIITDVMMPKISGFDMLDILRNAPETKDTKIIMMTALSQAEDKERADKLGADLYLVKSQVTLEDVADSVRKILGGEAAAPSVPAAPPAETTPPAPVESPAPVATPAVPAESQPAPVAVAPPAAPMPTLSGQPAAPAPPAAVGDDTAAVSAPAATPPAEENKPNPSEPVPVPAPVVEPVAPVPEPAPPTPEPPAPVAPPVPPKKIEVVLPDDTPQPVAASPSEAKPAEDPATAAPSATAELTPPADINPIGPTLAEALADEQKTVTGSEPITTVEETPAPVAAPTVIQPSETAASDTAAPALTANEEDNPNKRVIQPLNDPTKGPDLEALVAKETAPSTDTPAPSATIEPDPSKVDNAQPESQQDKPAQADDFSKISL